MVATFNSETSLELKWLESYIRTALESGELLPAMEAQIQGWASAPELSERDRTLLEIFQNALDSGCIRRVKIDSRFDCFDCAANL